MRGGVAVIVPSPRASSPLALILGRLLGTHAEERGGAVLWPEACLRRGGFPGAREDNAQWA